MSNSITREDIDVLVAFLPLFEDLEATFVTEWVAKTGTFPYPDYTKDVRDFFMRAGQPQWCDYDYNPEAAGDMVNDDRRIAGATLDEIRTMLTFCVRGERFCDGHWEHMLKEGRIRALLRRLTKLREELP